MIDQFVVGFKAQKKWSWLAAIDFFLGGMGTGAFLISLYFGYTAGMIAGLVSVGLGALALLLDLERPERSWRAATKVSYSWISRGTIFTALFLVFGILYIAPDFFSGLPWSRGMGLGQAIGVIAVLGAVGVMLYTGFLLAHSPSIPFWNTTLLPLLFALNALTNGAGLLFVLFPAMGQGTVNMRGVELLGVLLIAGSLLSLWIYMLNTYYSSIAAKESVRLLLRGKLSVLFLLGVNVLGMMVPLGIMLLIYSGNGVEGMSSAQPLAGLLILLGGFLFRYTMLKAGIYAPVV